MKALMIALVAAGTLGAATAQADTTPGSKNDHGHLKHMMHMKMHCKMMKTWHHHHVVWVKKCW